MQIMPNRDDEVYIQIENFQDYEFTQCIAYEMAVRNDEIKELLFDEYVFPVLLSDHSEDVHPYKEFITQKLKEKYFIGDKFLKYFKSTFDNRLQDEKLISKTYHYIKYGAYEENWNLLAGKFGFKSIEDMHQRSIFEREYIVKYIIHMLYSIEKLNIVYEDKSYVKSFYDFSNGGIPAKMFEPIGELKRKSEDLGIFGKPLMRKPIFKTNIKLSRPKFEIPIQLQQSIQIKINLVLPVSELKAYIQKIKNDYDKNNSIIKTSSELFGETLHKTNNKVFKQSQAQKIADWFFVYDYYKILKRNSSMSDDNVFDEIDLKLSFFYGLEDANKDCYSRVTFRKTIMKNMKYLIDNLGYKELLTHTS